MQSKNIFKKIDHPIFVAEISANHNGSFLNAKKIIDMAVSNGADAIKLQTYEADSMTLNAKKDYLKIKNGIWKNKYLWDLYKAASTPFDWQRELFDYCKQKKIFCFSTPFDRKAVDLLESVNCPIYKVASFEITDIPLIRYIASKKKDMIISTGMSNLKEISLAYETAIKFGAKSVVLLYCVSTYPAKKADFNLNNINILQKKFNCKVGFSDHSNDLNIARMAVAHGAEIFEKHVALPNQKYSPDIKFSLKGKQVKEYIKCINEAYKISGKKEFVRKESEMQYKSLRRSIFAIKNISKGEIYTLENIKCLRPNIGLNPKFFNKILGKKSKKNIKKNSPIKKDTQ